MVELIYDGSFEGLLTCVFDAYDKKYRISNIQEEMNLQNSFTKQIFIVTDTIKAQRVYKGAQKKIGTIAMQKLYRVFLSNNDRRSILIFKMLKEGFKLGPSVVNFLQNDDIREFVEIDKKVSFESHRILGLLRFKKISSNNYNYVDSNLPDLIQKREGIFYAVYEPDNNITFLIADHFKQRMADQCFIIHDKKRKIAAVYDKREVIFTSLERIPDFKEDNEELLYRRLWKEYFHNIAIEERENPRCQLNFMPRRYWKHLTEIYD